MRPLGIEGSRTSACLLKSVLPNDSRPSPGGWFEVSVQDVGIKVDADWPRHGASDLVYRRGGERLVVVDDAEDAWQGAGKVEFTDEPVGERDTQHAPAEGFDGCDPSERRHGLSLLEGFDGRESAR